MHITLLALLCLYFTLSQAVNSNCHQLERRDDPLIVDTGRDPTECKKKVQSNVDPDPIGEFLSCYLPGNP
jgi:hypothetical protein